jgi:hypothetical protein
LHQDINNSALDLRLEFNRLLCGQRTDENGTVLKFTRTQGCDLDGNSRSMGFRFRLTTGGGYQAGKHKGTQNSRRWRKPILQGRSMGIAHKEEPKQLAG